ncbi:MAG: hypothetical protein ABH833_00715 [Parcubacteria group bacterium]
MEDILYFLNTNSDAITAVSAIVITALAVYGIAEWKRKIKGAKEFETAYELHYSVLEVRSAIKHVRNPAIWPGEDREALKTKYPDRPSEDREKNSHWYVYEARWEKIINAYTKMESHLLAAEVLWGPEIFNKIKPLKKKVTELNIKLRQYLDPALRTSSSGDLDAIVYDSSNEDGEDTFSLEVSQVIKEIADYIKQKIS